MGAQARSGKARRARLSERREAYFDLMMSGYSVEQIAKAMSMSASAVRRAVRQAIDQRRLEFCGRLHAFPGRAAQQGAALRRPVFGGGRTEGDPSFRESRGRLDRYHGLAAGLLRPRLRLSRASEACPAAARLAAAGADPRRRGGPRGALHGPL